MQHTALAVHMVLSQERSETGGRKRLFRETSPEHVRLRLVVRTNMVDKRELLGILANRAWYAIDAARCVFALLATDVQVEEGDDVVDVRGGVGQEVVTADREEERAGDSRAA